MFTQKVALVTGASQGIGKSLALGLAQDGYKLILVSRNFKKLRETARKINKTTAANPDLEAEVAALDVSNYDQVNNLISNLDQKYGRIDVLVNSAGIGGHGTLSFRPEEFEKMLSINLVAPFCFFKHVVPLMKRNKSGYIFNIASRCGKVGVAGIGPYVSSKYGLVGLSEVIFRELAAHNIKVTTLCPGWVNTQMAMDTNCPHHPTDIIQTSDLLDTVRWLLNLSPPVRVMEILLECVPDIETRNSREYTMLRQKVAEAGIDVYKPE